MTLSSVLFWQFIFGFVSVSAWSVWAVMVSPAELMDMMSSALLGSLACFIPAAFFAGLMRCFGGSFSVIAFAEMLKIVLTLVMFFCAIEWVSNLRWTPLLSSYFLVLKSYWFVLALKK
ncbi:MAG: ATP synthase subunit I [Ottowia sp.]|nr:ATP synthase subunit I [Ottowia sp.]